MFNYLPCSFTVKFLHKFVHLPTMLFYREILSQNLFPYLLCCFIVTFCHKICSPTYHAVLSQYVVTKFVQLPSMLFYHNILVQNLFTYLPCCFIVTFFHQICSPSCHARVASFSGDPLLTIGLWFLKTPITERFLWKDQVALEVS